MVTLCTFEPLNGDAWECRACGRQVRSTTPNIHAECGVGLPERRPCGPGCQLKRTLEWWGIRDDGSCGCDEFAARMDAWGPAECWTRLEEIVDHLAEQAAKRGLPFVATAARIAVARAIQAAEKEVSNAAPQAAEADPRRPG